MSNNNNSGNNNGICAAIIGAIAVIIAAIIGYYATRNSSKPSITSRNCEQKFVYYDNETSTTKHSLEFLNLKADSPCEILQVGDSINIQFTLQNVSAQDIQLEHTFIAARNSQNENVDFGYSNEGVTIKPQQEILTKSNTIVDREGTWKFWPCYEIKGYSSEDGYCPPEWQAFEVNVKKSQ